MENKEEKRIYTFEELEEFCKKHNRFPSNKRGESGLYYFLKKHKDEPRFKELYEKYRKRLQHAHTYEELEEFCTKHNRHPSAKKNDEVSLYNFLYHHKDEPRFKELYEKHRRIYNNYSYTYEELEEFCKEHNRLPNIKQRESGLYHFLKKHKDEPRFKKLYRKYGKKTYDYTYEELEEFCIRHNRFPSNKRGESGLYRFYLKHRDKPKFKKLYEKYRKRVQRYDYTYEELEEFCIRHNRLPTSSKKKGEVSLYKFLMKHKNEPRFKELYEKYNRVHHYTYEELEEFCIKHNRLPNFSETSLYNFLYHHKDEPKFKDLIEKYKDGPIYNLDPRLQDITIFDFEYLDFDDLVLLGLDCSGSAIDKIASTEIDTQNRKDTIGRLAEDLGYEMPERQKVFGISRSMKTILTLERILTNITLSGELYDLLKVKKVKDFWQEIINDSYSNSYTTIEELRSLEKSEHSDWLWEIRGVVLREYSEVINLDTTCIYCLPDTIRPDLLQKYVAYRLDRALYFGNWSEVGSGKTLSALYASRYSRMRITIYVSPVSVKDTVKREIKKCYGKDSVVIDYNGKEDCLDAIDKNKFNYILINYDKFRTSDILEEPIMNLVKSGEVDFMVLDEIQRAKKMEDSKESNTYRYLKTMRMEAQKHNPKLKVLGLSATPFKNDLTELHSVLELLSGVSPKFKTRNKTIKNKVFARYELFENGIRISGNSDFDVKVNTYFTETNGNSIKENLISQDKMSWSVVDMALTKTKLDSITDEIKSKTIIYSISTISIPVIESWVKEKGFTYEIYTGETDVRDRNSILEDKFINGDCDIIIASSPIGTGIDGLQKCCKRIVILSLPWTNADYVQLIGRIARRGSMFSEVDVYIPQVAINLKSREIWSWDRRRFDFIRTKRILSEQILCGFYNEETEEISSGFLELFTENALSDLRKGEE